MIRYIEDPTYIWLPGSVPSLKNGKIKTKRGVFSSKAVKKYLRSFGIEKYSTSKKEVKYYKRATETPFYEYFDIFNEMGVARPLKLGFHFVRGTRHKFDFNNANQVVLDLMVAHGIVEDDNMDFVLPFPMEIEGRYYTYDKDSPGVLIKILE